MIHQFQDISTWFGPYVIRRKFKIILSWNHRASAQFLKLHQISNKHHNNSFLTTLLIHSFILRYLDFQINLITFLRQNWRSKLIFGWRLLFLNQCRQIWLLLTVYRSVNCSFILSFWKPLISWVIHFLTFNHYLIHRTCAWLGCCL